MIFLALLALAATDVRERVDGDGRLVHRLTLEDGQLIEEVELEYDRGALVRRVTTRPGAPAHVETWRYEGPLLVWREVSDDGVVRSRETSTYTHGRLTSVKTEVPGEPTRLSTTFYDPFGRVERVETVAQDVVVATTRVERDRPAVPLRVEAHGGGALATDVGSASLTAGFSVNRAPPEPIWPLDPLELRARLDWGYARVGAVPISNHLSGELGLDWNHLLPRQTFFLFSNFERDPVANLGLDLYVAPAGYKLDLLGPGPLAADVSFAPVWNHREVPGIVTDKVRGSLRARLRYTTPAVMVGDTLEVLPNLGDPADLIVRDTVKLSLALSSWLRLEQTLVGTSDPTLSEQADCAADPDDLRCHGLEVTTATTLNLGFALP